MTNLNNPPRKKMLEHKTLIKASKIFITFLLFIVCFLLNVCLLLSRGDINRLIYKSGTNQLAVGFFQVAYLSLYIVCNQALFTLFICFTQFYYEKAIRNDAHGIKKFSQLKSRTKLKCLLQFAISLQFFVVLFLFTYYQSDIFSRLRLFFNVKSFRGYLYFVLCMIALSLSLSMFLSLVLSLIYKNFLSIRMHRKIKNSSF